MELRPELRSLFTAQELEVARKRLAQMGYQVPEGPAPAASLSQRVITVFAPATPR